MRIATILAATIRYIVEGVKMATMLAYEEPPLERRVPPRNQGLADLVEAIGLDDFGAHLLAMFDHAVGADHCVVYQMRNYELTEIVSGMKTGVPVPEAYLGTYTINRRFRHLGQSPASVELYDLIRPQPAPFLSEAVPQGILIFGNRRDAQYCVRVLRLIDRERLAEVDLSALQDIAHLIVSLVARHYALTEAKPTSFAALTSLKGIQNRIQATKCLSRRESEVCARILYGYSSCEIAVDLRIGKESVMTYRKRAYQHLGLSSQRELLMWYLEQAPDPHSC
jgi:DNA-binding CsgD family transcriptional regulator